MSGRPLQNVIEYLRRAVGFADSSGVPDAELLERYAGRRDEAAFELLVWRHAKMVFGVCRRLLGYEEDAEDAFQATFLLLARRAQSIGRRESVGGWLHTVARRVALEAKACADRRLARERPTDEWTFESGSPGPPSEAAWRELREALDEQVGRLPEKYRTVFVLRCLEGRSSAEAARELGCAPGTVESRLTRARQRLRAGLERRGLGPLAGLLAAELAGNLAAGEAPAALVSSTSKAAVLLAGGGVAPARAAALMEGVLKTMSMTRIKIVTAAVLVAALAGLGAGWSLRPALAQTPPPKAAGPREVARKKEASLPSLLQTLQWVVRKVDAEKNTLTLTLPFPNPGSPIEGEANHLVSDFAIVAACERFTLEDLAVAKDANVLIDGKAGGLKDLRRQMRVSLRLAAGKPAVIRIDATSPPAAVLKSTDVEKNTITVSMAGKDVTVPLRFDTKIRYAWLGGKDLSFTDLKPGMRVDLLLCVDGDKIVVKLLKVWK